MDENTPVFPGKFLQNRTLKAQRFERGSVFNYSAYLPERAIGQKNLALFVLLEYSDVALIPIMEKLTNDGCMPPGLIIFAHPGVLPAAISGGTDRNMRAEEFDQYGREFSDFLVEELIPDAVQQLDCHISPSPDAGMITGGSSGGLAAWNAVWFRNDRFRRVFLSSPTFSAMRGGEEPMVLLRKTEQRPIRIYLTTGTTEPDYFFGSSYYAACNAAKAFDYAGYDYKFDLFPNEGHCTRRGDPVLLRNVMKYLFANYPDPVKTRMPQLRLRQTLAESSVWEETNETFPVRSVVITLPGGKYCADAETVFFMPAGTTEKIPVYSGFRHITGLGLSTDGWRLYVSDRDSRFIYALTLEADHTVSSCYKLAPIHLAHDCRTIGASALAVAENDRVFAATDLGIQGIVSFGLTDIILPLPQDLPATDVALCENTLYAASGKRVFKRTLKIAERKDGQNPPSTPTYGDGFDYSIVHLPQ